MFDHIAICCADEMIVGRWYKIITFPAYDSGLDAIRDYTVNYTCTDDCVLLCHDTVYVKKASESFTITATDMNGYTTSKTVKTIEDPNVERTVYEYIPTDWEDLRTKISDCGENSYISIPYGEYTFNLTDTAISLPYGAIIDFNESKVNITTELENIAYSGFCITEDFSGVVNANFIGIDVGKGSTYHETMSDNTVYEKCGMIIIYAGDYCKVQNLSFADLAGFNFSVGTWLKSSRSRWRATNNYNGYIADDGTLASETTAWTMAEMVEIHTTTDRGYTVGVIGWGYGPVIGSSRVYDIAFYDSEKNVIQVERDHQFYRKYYYPENAVYVRYGVWRTTEPQELTGYDYDCIMAMWGGSKYTDKCGNVKELLIDNISYKNHASGAFSGTGWLEDIHINRMKAIGDGWLNNWCFDFEDGWEAMINGVVSHSVLSGQCVAHSIQGITFLSCVLGPLILATRCYFATVINSLAINSQLRSTRGCVTTINSYTGAETVNSDSGGMHKFGVIDSEIATEIRTECLKRLT